MKEIWKPIEGFKNYEISNLGIARSLDRIEVNSLGISRNLKGKVLKNSLNAQGYLNIRLYKNIKGYTKEIHQLVAIAFKNHIPNGLKIVVDHKDNNPLNNRVNNLQLISNRENCSKDRFRGDYSSKYTGVYWHKKNSKWSANISINGNQKYIGIFTNEIDAHNAYQKELNKLNK